MEVPGITVIDCVITDECRKMRTTEGALNEAFERIKKEYLEILNKRGHEKGINYRVVLLVETPMFSKDQYSLPLKIECNHCEELSDEHNVICSGCNSWICKKCNELNDEEKECPGWKDK